MTSSPSPRARRDTHATLKLLIVSPTESRTLTAARTIATAPDAAHGLPVDKATAMQLMMGVALKGFVVADVS